MTTAQISLILQLLNDSLEAEKKILYILQQQENSTKKRLAINYSNFHITHLEDRIKSFKKELESTEG